MMDDNEYLNLRQKLEEHCNKCMIDGYKRRDIETGLALLGLLVCCVIGLFIIGFTWYCNGQESIIQELCTRQQYDFCEVVESKLIYKLKEFKE